MVQHLLKSPQPPEICPLMYTFLLERHLTNVHLQEFNYNAKQSCRWLRARLLSSDRSFLTQEAASQLAKHFAKTEDQLRHPRIIDTVLIPDAQRALSQLDLEREAAKARQGYPTRVQDWWAAPTMVGKKKRWKLKAVGENQGATACEGVFGEGLGDEEIDEEEGGVPVEEEFVGFDSPVMMSPSGSVGDDGGEEEEEEEEL